MNWSDAGYLDDMKFGQKVAVGQRQFVSIQVFAFGFPRLNLVR